MELRQLATFRLVANTLSFSRTAQILNYVQSEYHNADTGT